jgi:hypothetical protein
VPILSRDQRERFRTNWWAYFLTVPKVTKDNACAPAGPRRLNALTLRKRVVLPPPHHYPSEGPRLILGASGAQQSAEMRWTRDIGRATHSAAINRDAVADSKTKAASSARSRLDPCFFGPGGGERRPCSFLLSQRNALSVSAGPWYFAVAFPIYIVIGPPLPMLTLPLV